MEWPFESGGKRQYLDLRCRVEGRWVGLELKYMTRGEVLTVGDEVFALRNHGAQDTRRYDFWRDMARLEGLVASGEIAWGFALALTNDSLYWRRPTRETCDAAFRVHEGRAVNPSTLAWAEGAGEGTKRGRIECLQVSGRHVLRWREYSQPTGAIGFRWMIAEAGSCQGTDQRG